MNLKRFAVCVYVVGLVCIFSGHNAQADWNKQGLASTVRVKTVQLDLLQDGGCAVTAYATYEVDGGATLGSSTVSEASERTEVAGANRTTCLDILNNKAPVLFKTDKGL